eukprot:529271-Prorocentrum_minimum.AAC.1
MSSSTDISRGTANCKCLCRPRCISTTRFNDKVNASSDARVFSSSAAPFSVDSAVLSPDPTVVVASPEGAGEGASAASPAPTPTRPAPPLTLEGSTLEVSSTLSDSEELLRNSLCLLCTVCFMASSSCRKKTDSKLDGGVLGGFSGLLGEPVAAGFLPE